MSLEHLSKLRVIAVTALVTFALTLTGAVALFSRVSRQAPPTPTIAPPKTITVTLYPASGLALTGSPPTEIPARDFEYLMRLVTPDQYYGGGVSDWVTPLIAEVVITHEGRPDTQLLIREAGVNPALISLDGQNYFYGASYDDVGDGAVQVIRLVRRLGDAKPR